MPSSVEEGKDWSIKEVLKRSHVTVLDIGPGVGTYSKLLRKHVQRMDAVEVFKPYVTKYNLESQYDSVTVANFLDFETDMHYDWIILGDVLEHFNDEDAKLAYKKAQGLADYILLSCPDGEFEQGTVEGNVHETHLSTYTYDQVKSWPGVESIWRGQIVLVAIIKT